MPYHCRDMAEPWDPKKAERNFGEHGVTFEDAVRVLGDPYYIIEDQPDSFAEHGEERFRVIGMVEGRLLFVVLTERGEELRPISARKATRRERERYEQAQRKGPWQD